MIYPHNLEAKLCLKRERRVSQLAFIQIWHGDFHLVCTLDGLYENLESDPHSVSVFFF